MDEKARAVGATARLCPVVHRQLTLVTSYLNHPVLRHQTLSIVPAPAAHSFKKWLLPSRTPPPTAPLKYSEPCFCRASCRRPRACRHAELERRRLGCYDWETVLMSGARRRKVCRNAEQIGGTLEETVRLCGETLLHQKSKEMVQSL